MNVAPILIMVSAVFVFSVTALSIATLLGLAIGQVRHFFRNKAQV
ncbi:MAG: hypothetical protein P8171_08125 [Candidatus Thiodiazotropha sp.]